jgi:hypothetical protein
MPADYEHYTRLEPNHDVEVDEDGYQIVSCPFTDPETGQSYQTTWAPTADGDEIDCMFCDHLNALAGKNPDGFLDHDCHEERLAEDSE